jgi:hypothetical protein
VKTAVKVRDSLHKYRGCIAVKTISAYIDCDTICGTAAHLQYTSSSLRLRSVSARSFVIKESGFLLIARTNSKEPCQTPKPLNFESLDPVPYGSDRCGWIRPEKSKNTYQAKWSGFLCLFIDPRYEWAINFRCPNFQTLLSLLLIG